MLPPESCVIAHGPPMTLVTGVMIVHNLVRNTWQSGAGRRHGLSDYVRGVGRGETEPCEGGGIAVIGSSGTSGSIAVAGSIASAGSIAVAGSVATDCIDCTGCVGCVGLRGAVGQRGVVRV